MSRHSPQRLLVSALQPLQKLTHLRVVIGTSVYVHELAAPPPFAPWEDSEYAHSFRPSRFDSEGTATALARAVPSLRNVFLTVGGFLSTLGERGGGSYWKPYERWYTHRGWRVGIPGRVEAPEGERRVFELHEEVVDTIVRKEELVLSEEDEVSVSWHRAREMKLSMASRDADGAPLTVWLAHLSAAPVRVGCRGEHDGQCCDCRLGGHILVRLD